MNGCAAAAGLRPKVLSPPIRFQGVAEWTRLVAVLPW